MCKLFVNILDNFSIIIYLNKALSNKHLNEFFSITNYISQTFLIIFFKDFNDSTPKVARTKR